MKELYKLRKAYENEAGTCHQITVPFKIAREFENVFFRIYASGGMIVMVSGARKE